MVHGSQLRRTDSWIISTAWGFQVLTSQKVGRYCLGLLAVRQVYPFVSFIHPKLKGMALTPVCFCLVLTDN